MPLIRRSITAVKTARPRPRILSSPLRAGRRGPPPYVGGSTRKRRSLLQASFARTPKAKSGNSHVKVAVRVRPRNERETGNETATTVVKPFGNSVLFDPDVEDDHPFFHNGRRQLLPSAARRKHQNISYTYDFVFSDSATNNEVFDGTMTEVIDMVLEGYNGSVFAYGATGAGKTHTMLGNAIDPGITYLTAAELFRRTQDRPDVAVEFTVSYLEVYNELVFDLLEAGKDALQVMEDGKYVSVKGLSWHTPKTPGELLNMLATGNQRRAQSATNANKDSSRSHAVFTIQICQREIVAADAGECAELPQKKFSKLVLVDLAGSERASANSGSGARFKEGTNINKSLLALGQCINDLVEGKSHINFRGSKLTRILKDCLGGNCRTVMLAAISPTSLQFSDTKNTLEYASRARKITCSLKQNVRTAAQSTSQLISLIAEVNSELARERLEKTDMREEISRLQDRVRVLEEREAALTVQAARAAETTGLADFDDLLSLLNEKLRQQREWDAELHELWREKSGGHFRLERARVSESQFDFVRCLTDEVRYKPDYARVKMQVEKHLARIKALEEDLVKKMESNAADIQELSSQISGRAETLQNSSASQNGVPLAVRLAGGLLAKLEAQSARATEQHYKYLLTEAERELAHYQRLAGVALPVLKRSCLLAQRNGRDQTIDASIKTLQQVVARREGIQFDGDEVKSVASGDVAAMPATMLVAFGHRSDAVRAFIPPLPCSPAAPAFAVHRDAGDGAGADPYDGRLSSGVPSSSSSDVASAVPVRLRPATKEKWVKVLPDLADLETVEEVSVDAVVVGAGLAVSSSSSSSAAAVFPGRTFVSSSDAREEPSSELGTPTTDRSASTAVDDAWQVSSSTTTTATAMNGGSAARSAPLREDWTNIVSSTPFARSFRGSKEFEPLPPVTPATPGSTIVNYSVSDDDDGDEAEAAPVPETERTWVKDDPNSENRDPGTASFAPKTSASAAASSSSSSSPGARTTASKGRHVLPAGKPGVSSATKNYVQRQNQQQQPQQNNNHQRNVVRRPKPQSFGSGAKPTVLAAAPASAADQLPFRPRPGGSSGGSGGGFRALPAFGLPIQQPPFGRLVSNGAGAQHEPAVAPSAAAAAAAGNAHRIGAVRFSAPIPAHLRYGGQ